MTNSGGGLNGVSGNFGEAAGVWLDDADGYSIALTLNTPTVVNKVNSAGGLVALNAGALSGSATADGDAGSITFNKVGVYEVSFSSSFESTGSAKVDGAIRLNGVRCGEVAFERDIANPNDVGSVGPSHTIKILSGDLPAVIDVILTVDASRTLTLKHFSLHGIGAGL